MNNNFKILLLISLFLIVALLALFYITDSSRVGGNNESEPEIMKLTIDDGKFDGKNALNYLEQQVAFGPRTPGSGGHSQTLKWMQETINNHGWMYEVQTGNILDYPISNVVAKYGNGEPWIIFGAHYDTRILSDQDPILENRITPVPGANDGASGVAILLELIRVIPDDYQGEVWVVFFDAEDNGNIEGREWIMGSRMFVQSLTRKPDYMILLDMVGDVDLNIYKERNSDNQLMDEIWSKADLLGYGDYFLDLEKYRMVDDHIPFIQSGIKAVDIIDFDYPYWHTTEDTIDKVSAESLQIVGDTILSWLLDDHK
jgi:hypothetical protein